MKVIGIAGSTRDNSYNKVLLEWIGSLLKDSGVELEIVNIEKIPIVINDYREGPAPKEVKEIKVKIKSAMGVIISTPQYNYTFPEILRNTIDWMAYPKEDNVWMGKKGYIIGASIDPSGVNKAEEKLRKYMINLGVSVFEKEPIVVNKAGGMFDEQGKLLDTSIEPVAKKALKEFVEWLNNK